MHKCPSGDLLVGRDDAIAADLRAVQAEIGSIVQCHAAEVLHSELCPDVVVILHARQRAAQADSVCLAQMNLVCAIKRDTLVSAVQPRGDTVLQLDIFQVDCAGTGAIKFPPINWPNTFRP